MAALNHNFKIATLFIDTGRSHIHGIGNAVIRNKSRRRLRAIVREVLTKYASPQTDYVFIARSTTATCCFKELRRDVIYALKRINKNFISPQITDTGNESSVTGKKTVYTQNSSPDTAQNDSAVTDVANPADRPHI